MLLLLCHEDPGEPEALQMISLAQMAGNRSPPRDRAEMPTRKWDQAPKFSSPFMLPLLHSTKLVAPRVDFLHPWFRRDRLLLRAGHQAEHNIAGEPGAVSFVAAGLPPGMALDPQTGLISGAPREAGDFHGLVGSVDSPGDVTRGPIHFKVYPEQGDPPASRTLALHMRTWVSYASSLLVEHADEFTQWKVPGSLVAVAHGAHGFAATTSTGKIFTSLDGDEWAERAAGA